ncbi:unnamed protein product [Peronospora belbahrii]|uniref:PX domain-containing protein n=1 Tax=Peronospora belbahrii TaxID=622444 RepID=A0ABN8D8Q2_9STRA|nr:unnamed protein product [Peronospora belbahrii]
MPLDVVIKVPSSCADPAPLETSTLVLLHHNGHFRILERTLRDFLHLERQLQLESQAKTFFSDSASISSSFEAYCDAKRSFYPSNQHGIRLAITLETFLRRLTLNSELLTMSLALKTFFDGNILTSHKTTGRSYRDTVEAAMGSEEKDMELGKERVAAGCSMERHIAVNVEEEKQQVVLWKFVSQGTGLVFSALFSNEDEGKCVEMDPYSVSNDNVVEKKANEIEVAHYKTDCTFKTEDGDVYGHYVAKKNGVVTLLWENLDMDSVISKSLQFQATVVSLSAAEKILEVANALKTVDTPEWLHEYVDMSEITAVEDLVGWEYNEIGEVVDEHEAHDDDHAGRDRDVESQIQSAVLEECNHELEAQVARLEENLTTTKKELKNALDRVHIAEEIYKANLETITQLECGTVNGTAPKSWRVPTALPAGSHSETLDLNSTQTEETPSSELERMQQLCAGFQEQCLWRSVENMELEAQLAASQVEASSWRQRHVEQAAQVEELEKQNCILRKHKKILVQEVKRLQPYSHVNLAALVQEAQEARMVQRSLQAQLDSHELLKSEIKVDTSPIESEPADFVLVEASDDENVFE